ncbi:hypothetical protein [Albidovulum sediminis]|uniref:Uncharacterized protein n=1 Tax=Albidovulum sediminis TaxID=3066345 RepID=A0ABT2NPB3_9RHOB|nr:hypothetical protein [Defluviimonas sediminis]MCT8330767.1 hypothetical protein [Defluviimonas sediminis]
MIWFNRPILVLLLAVTLFGAATLQHTSGVASEIATSMAHCCDGDCPDEPVCDHPCSLMARCSGALAVPAFSSGPDALVAAEGSAEFSLDQPLPSDHSPAGLKRPPRV